MQGGDIRTTIGIVGIPFCLGQEKDGTENGPQVLRDGGLVGRLESIGRNVHDRGDIKFDTIINDPPVRNVNCSRNVASASLKIADEVERSLRRDEHCLALGGDHSMAIGTILGHARVHPNVAVLWVDAHADINTPQTSDSGNLHGMPLSFLTKELESNMPKLPGWENIKPCISAENIAWIGLRSVDKGERKIIEKRNMTAFYIQDVDKYGIKDVVVRALDAIDPEGTRPIHLSLDVDGMDPSLTPSTGTPVADGLTLQESFCIAEEVASTGRLSVVDIAEFNPSLGNKGDVNHTVKAILDVMERIYANKPE